MSTLSVSLSLHFVASLLVLLSHVRTPIHPYPRYTSSCHTHTHTCIHTFIYPNVAFYSLIYPPSLFFSCKFLESITASPLSFLSFIFSTTLSTRVLHLVYISFPVFHQSIPPHFAFTSFPYHFFLLRCFPSLCVLLSLSSFTPLHKRSFLVLSFVLPAHHLSPLHLPHLSIQHRPQNLSSPHDTASDPLVAAVPFRPFDHLDLVQRPTTCMCSPSSFVLGLAIPVLLFFFLCFACVGSCMALLVAAALFTYN